METIEWLRMAFERDDPFTMGEDKCFYHIDSGDIAWASDKEWSGLESSEVYESNEKWIEVPGTSHGEWHRVFVEWLEEKELSHFYTTSIGLTLKHLDEIDENLRREWYDKKYKYAEFKAKEWLKKYS